MGRINYQKIRGVPGSLETLVPRTTSDTRIRTSQFAFSSVAIGGAPIEGSTSALWTPTTPVIITRLHMVAWWSDGAPGARGNSSLNLSAPVTGNLNSGPVPNLAETLGFEFHDYELVFGFGVHDNQLLFPEGIYIPVLAQGILVGCQLWADNAAGFPAGANLTWLLQMDYKTA